MSNTSFPDASDSTHRTTRIVSVIAATAVALACGTNYVYSAWAPQFAERMKLSSTQSNLIGSAGNLGMYGFGIPVGLLVDRKGPRPGVILGSLLLLVGYLPMHLAYDAGPGSISVAALCFFSLLTGCGSCSAFSGAIKSSALNWPHHRGTATAFPLSAFGLSAIFFSTISSLIFSDNTSGFLLLLSIGTFGLTLVSVFFLRIVPQTGAYTRIPAHERRNSDPHRAHRRKSEQGHYQNNAEEPDEISSLLSTSPDPEQSATDLPRAKIDEGHNHHLDIRGLVLLSKPDFWQLFSLLGLLTGVGLMTINNIGSDARALWIHYDDSVPREFIQNRQVVHVCVLSAMNFLGRLSSGIGSDLIVKRMGMSRFWCVIAASTVFCVAQLSATQINNPHSLFVVSGLTGLGYGFLFGVYPALVSEKFGVHGLSQNWGCMIFAPVISAELFNLIYGAVYDKHSVVLPDGERQCQEGLACYREAYWVTLGASVLGLCISFWCVYHERAEQKKLARREGLEAGHES
ncbi:MFS transporter [Xylona heveae TC161]|uniref:MFS transporter n=1 Tax=Xylona heveae (strain CBS 132557 / TC161) TaxID=1328760 RepID=A0A165HFG1_XYLHT|nr:MFS transporter [Xylona heveae TC161]KZF23431.1 MFS transporter [Xylona heveae TC161]